MQSSCLLLIYSCPPSFLYCVVHIIPYPLQEFEKIFRKGTYSLLKSDYKSLRMGYDTGYAM